MDIKVHISERAPALGFHAQGVASALPLPDDAERLSRWLDRGHHAGMSYLERWTEVRRDPSHAGMVQGARTVVSLAMAYPWSEAETEGVTPLLARYARGDDYHLVVRSRLTALLDELRRLVPGLRGRVLVDTAPLFERAWAVRAGLGWIGRNTCLIHPELGSAFVLGELVLSAEVEPDQPMADRCGECRACVDACPTDALVRPDGHQLDTRRCLSYWTVEARDPIPESLAAQEVLFGCDACQLACPWNQGRDDLDSPITPLERWRGTTLEKLAQMPDRELETLIRETALERTGAACIRARARRLLDRARRDP